MSFDFFAELRRITEAHLAQTQVGIPDSIRLKLRQKYADEFDIDPPDRYGMTEDERLDDPRRGQAESINRERR